MFCLVSQLILKQTGSVFMNSTDLWSEQIKSESEAQMIQHENKTSAAQVPPETQTISNYFNLFFYIWHFFFPSSALVWSSWTEPPSAKNLFNLEPNPMEQFHLQYLVSLINSWKHIQFSRAPNARVMKTKRLLKHQEGTIWFCSSCGPDTKSQNLTGGNGSVQFWYKEPSFYKTCFKSSHSVPPETSLVLKRSSSHAWHHHHHHQLHTNSGLSRVVVLPSQRFQRQRRGSWRFWSHQESCRGKQEPEPAI